MLYKAEGKRVYESLHEMEIIEFLHTTDQKFDLFISTDVFIYLGDMEPVFSGIVRCALPTSYFVFSVEETSGDDYILQHTGRFAHSSEFIRKLADKFSFAILSENRVNIRLCKEGWIPGLALVLRKS